MTRPFATPVFWLFMAVALVAGGVLIAAAAWLRPLTEAQQALAEGRYEPALQQYAAAETRFGKTQVMRQIAPALYRISVDDQLWLLYRMGEYDKVLEKSATSPSTAAVHFWAGSAAFHKWLGEQQQEARLAWLGRAEEEFRKSIEHDRTNWDAKYNFEMTKRILNELKQKPKTPPQQILQLLRPQPKQTGEPAKRVG